MACREGELTTASIFKAKGATRYTILYYDHNGKRRKKIAGTDKADVQRIANKLEDLVALRHAGIVDPKAEAYRDHAAQPLTVHVDAWVASLQSKGATAQHVKLHSSRTRRGIALIKGARLAEIEPKRPTTVAESARAAGELRKWVATARLADVTTENVHNALAKLRAEGRSLQTLNHQRTAIKAFAKWCYETYRLQENPLRGVAGFNVKEDVRYERRTISLDELRRLIEAARTGEPFRSMTGPMRALCYRLAVASGLRYSELASVTPESFDWQAKPATVVIRAAYAKNGTTATLPLPDDLAHDLAA